MARGIEWVIGDLRLLAAWIYWIVTGRWVRLVLRSGFRYWTFEMAKAPYEVCAAGSLTRVEGLHEPGAHWTYKEVVVEDCYGILSSAVRKEDPRVIVDLGANVGLFSKICSALYPAACIYAYEPHPQAFRVLRRNAVGANIWCFPMAVTNDEGQRLDLSRASSTITRVGPVGTQAFGVVRSSEVAFGREIDLLKMDVEGSEWSILVDEALLRRTRLVRMEYHVWGGHSIEELGRLLRSGGHTIVRLFGRRVLRRGEFREVGYVWSRRT